MSKSIDLVPPHALKKVEAVEAGEICARVELAPEALAGLLPQLSPQGFLSVLIRGQHFPDAVRFLAHAVPVREGVWWACVTAEQMPLSQTEARCLDCAETWVYDGGETARRACLTAAETTGFKGASAYAALAAFWSGGSLAPEGAPDVPPHPSLAPIGVAASLLLAAASGDPVGAEGSFATIIARGLDIADGGNGRLAGDQPRRVRGGVAA